MDGDGATRVRAIKTTWQGASDMFPVWPGAPPTGSRALPQRAKARLAPRAQGVGLCCIGHEHDNAASLAVAVGAGMGLRQGGERQGAVDQRGKATRRPQIA